MVKIRRISEINADCFIIFGNFFDFGRGNGLVGVHLLDLRAAQMELAKNDVLGVFVTVPVGDGCRIVVSRTVEIARIDQSPAPYLIIGVGCAVVVMMGVFLPLVDLDHAAEHCRVLLHAECRIRQRNVLDGEFTPDSNQLTVIFRRIVIGSDLDDRLFDLVGGLDVADIVALVPPEHHGSDDHHEKTHQNACEQTAFFVVFHG